MSAVAVAVTPRRVLRSEWIKLTTLRSTVITFGAAVGMMIGVSVLISLITVSDWGTMSAVQRADGVSVLDRTLSGRFFAQLAIGVAGVIAISGEYATGMIRATLAAVPRRLPVLWAKLGIFAALTLVLMTFAAFASFFAGNALLARHWEFSLSDPGVLEAVSLTGVVLAAVCLLGTALGFILRNTAAAISTLFGILMVLPIVGEFSPKVAQYLPAGVMSALVHGRDEPNALTTGPALAVLGAYVAVAIAGAAFTLLRRDA